MIRRDLHKIVENALKQFPVVCITGPRQSGKTTLAQSLDKTFQYVNLERPDLREYSREDPLGFLEQYARGKLIIDEVQYAPELLSYIQAESDKRGKNGQFILTGSQNFLLLEKISQSLAGRAAILELLPLSIPELKLDGKIPDRYETLLFSGGYPKLYNEPDTDKQLMMNSYVRTYIERDVRQMINIRDISLFQRFLKACAARTGQLINYSALGNELALDHKTVMNWLSILQASYVLYLLPPYYENFNKRLVKSPKLYFMDTGLLSFLLDISNVSQMENHPLKGALFENLIFTELYKKSLNKGLKPTLYFWRDQSGNEVDFMEEYDGQTLAYEVKSSKTFKSNLLRGLEKFNKISGGNAQLKLIYGGEDRQSRNKIKIETWHSFIL